MLNSETDQPKTEYAFWVDPQTGLRVEYSLPLFHELDFQVNEGYRRIPHGGVEVGGVLWGRRTPDSIVVEAFRQIECEHASGPSFHLSPKDLEALATQLKANESSEELNSLQPVGWFIAHTRSPLRVTERERELFDKYFPGPNRMTLLVKPERFQPTRFGFLLRRADGTMPMDAAEQAVILPLPGRAGKGVIASIPAPAVRKTETPEVPVKPMAPVSQAEPKEEKPAPKEVIVMKPAGHAPAEAPTPEPTPEAPEPKPTPITMMPSPQTAAAEQQPRRTEQIKTVSEPTAPLMPVAAAPQRGSSLWRLSLALLLSAMLGAAVGYWGYLQLPSPTIDVHAERKGSVLLVQWPAMQTRDVDYAAYRINDGPAQLLTLPQKLSGELEVPISGEDTKVEVMAQHWFRDSHGYIRYLSAPSASPTGVETEKTGAKE